MVRSLLVTGGAGFIGANYVHHVLRTSTDDRVVVFDKLTYAGNLDNLRDIEGDPRYAFVHADIADRDAGRAVVDILGRNELAFQRHIGATWLDAPFSSGYGSTKADDQRQSLHKPGFHRLLLP